MPYELQELAAISGMPGLYRLVRAARHGVLVESLDERATRTLAPARNKVSLLAEISIYTQDPDQTVPLADVFERIHQQHGAAAPVTAKSSDAELTDFMAGIIPDYDRDRVYMSDIKKVATWFGIVSKHRPYREAPAAPAEAPTEAAPDADAAPASVALDAPKAKRKAAKPADEPAADEPLSTGGVITELDPEPTPTGDPEVTKTAPKRNRKKAE